MPPRHCSLVSTVSASQQVLRADVNGLYAQVRRRMIESGEWDQIRAILFSKLNESGWADDIRNRTKEQGRSMDSLSFQTLMSGIMQHARRESMPLAVEREITNLIRRHVDRQFE